MGAFEGLGTRLNHIFSKLRNKGALTELEIKQAMREVRIALLEADVNFTVAKNFIAQVTEKAIGEELRQLACRLVDVYLETLKEPKEECEPQPSTSKVITTES